MWKDVNQSYRCKGLFNLYFHPGTVPLGVFFFIQTRFEVGFSGVNGLRFHYTVWEKYSSMIKEYEKDGFCTWIYGQYDTILNKYIATLMRIFDNSNASLSDTVYTSEEYPFFHISNAIMFWKLQPRMLLFFYC